MLLNSIANRFRCLIIDDKKFKYREKTIVKVKKADLLCIWCKKVVQCRLVEGEDKKWICEKGHIFTQKFSL